MPEEYGGGGGDFLYDAIVMEELAWRRAHGIMTAVHSSICMPYILDLGTEEQKRAGCRRRSAARPPRHLHDRAGTGSDLANVQTRAIRDGDSLRAERRQDVHLDRPARRSLHRGREDRSRRQAAARGISLLLVEADTPGFVRGRKLEKLGLVAQDTSELFFQDCRVPARTSSGARARASRC
jgi:acyl-CoA dehydrogenase